MEDIVRRLAEVRGHLASDYLAIIHSELQEVVRLSKFCESISSRLDKYYEDIFPKKCSSCGAEYSNYNDYLSKTSRLENDHSARFDAIGLQDYRDCRCRSTLMIWTADSRRDDSEFGKKRRELFADCLEKLKNDLSLPKEEIEESLRKAFRVIGR